MCPRTLTHKCSEMIRRHRRTLPRLGMSTPNSHLCYFGMSDLCNHGDSCRRIHQQLHSNCAWWLSCTAEQHNCLRSLEMAKEKKKNQKIFIKKSLNSCLSLLKSTHEQNDHSNIFFLSSFCQSDHLTQDGNDKSGVVPSVTISTQRWTGNVLPKYKKKKVVKRFLVFGKQVWHQENSGLTIAAVSVVYKKKKKKSCRICTPWLICKWVDTKIGVTKNLLLKDREIQMSVGMPKFQTGQ